MKVVISEEARTAIRALHPEIRKQIQIAIDELRRNPYLGKVLGLELLGYRSLAISRYRIIHKIEGNTLTINHLGHRSGVYDEFSSALKKQNSN